MCWIWLATSHHRFDGILQVVLGGLSLTKGDIIQGALVAEDSFLVNDEKMRRSLSPICIRYAMIFIMQDEWQATFLANLR